MPEVSSTSVSITKVACCSYLANVLLLAFLSYISQYISTEIQYCSLRVILYYKFDDYCDSVMNPKIFVGSYSSQKLLPSLFL